MVCDDLRNAIAASDPGYAGFPGGFGHSPGDRRVYSRIEGRGDDVVRVQRLLGNQPRQGVGQA